MRASTFSFAICAGLISAPLAHPQSAEPIVPSEEFAEGYLGAAEVSSVGVLVGYSLSNAVNWKSNEISVEVPAGYDGELCLRATSLDGRFWSLNPHRVANATEQTTLGPVSKDFMKRLKQMPDESMAFRVSSKGAEGCEDIRESKFFPVSGEKNEALTFLVNSSGRQGFARLRFADGTTSEVSRCEKIANIIPVAADKRCKLSHSNTGEDAKVEFAFIGTSGKPEIVEFGIRIP